MGKKLMILLFTLILITGNLSLACNSQAESYHEYDNPETDLAPPYEADNPNPKNNAKCVPPSPFISVDLPNPPDPDGDAVMVCFHDATNLTMFDASEYSANGGTITAQWNYAKKPGKKYYWYVIIYDIWQIPTRSPGYPKNWSFKIDLPPDKPSNPKPINKERYVNITPKLSVDVSDPDGNPMDVTFYDATNIPSRVIGVANNIPSNTSASIIWKDLEYGTKYKWYAVADDGIFTNQSDTFSFTTNYLPSFSNIYPPDNAEDIPFDIDELSLDIVDKDGDSFTWSIMTYPYIGKNDGTNEINGTKTCIVNDLQPFTEYSWAVNATDMRGATRKAFFTFKTTENIAPILNLLSPENDDISISIANCVLNWSCDDPDGENDKLVYDIYFGKTANPPLIEENKSYNCYEIPYDLDLDTVYYWKVVATDVFGKITESDIYSFRTSRKPPPPAIGSINISFPRIVFPFGFVKADVKNIGVRDASDINWEINVNGGLLKRVNITKSGNITRLNKDDSNEISSYRFLELKTKIFGFGSIDIIVKISNIKKEKVGKEIREGFVIGPIVLIFN